MINKIDNYQYLAIIDNYRYFERYNFIDVYIDIR